MKGQEAFHPTSEGDAVRRPRRAGSPHWRRSARRRWPTPWHPAAMGTPVAMKAETTRRPLLPACASTLRMKCTRHLCQVAVKTIDRQEAIDPISEGDGASRRRRRRRRPRAFVGVRDHQLSAIKGQEAFDPIGEAGAARRPRRAVHAERAGGESRSRRSRPPRRRSSCRALSKASRPSIRPLKEARSGDREGRRPSVSTPTAMITATETPEAACRLGVGRSDRFGGPSRRSHRSAGVPMQPAAWGGQIYGQSPSIVRRRSIRALKGTGPAGPGGESDGREIRRRARRYPRRAAIPGSSRCRSSREP